MPTTSSGLRYPALTDSPNGPLQVGNLAADLDPKVLPSFGTIAARDAAIPNPGGARAALVAGRLHVHDGTAWRFSQRKYVTGTTDAAGLLTVNHGLGVQPTGFLLTVGPQATDLLNRVLALNYTNSDTANVVIYAHRTDTSALLPGQLIAFSMEAFV